jgi:methylated-DNA-[protein]-cysteine S-methyltransferase
MIMFVEAFVDGPVGRLRLLASTGGLAAVYWRDSDGPPADRGSSPVLEEAARQLAQYFRGERDTFDLPLAPIGGTPFEREVWTELARIPHGETISYAKLAERVGRPKAVRAVGRANAKNPLSIVVPCHRVIGKSGVLTGYSGGLEAKRWLLDHEIS